MTDNNIVQPKTPIKNALEEIIKQGAQQLLAKAVETEVSALLEKYEDITIDGKKAIVRNGHLPERTIQTGMGDIPVKIPKIRDKTGSGIKFNSKLVPPYLKRTKNLEEFIPWLYLKGISTGDMQPALETLLGKGVSGLSSNTVSRLKQDWEQDYNQWRKRDLSNRRFVYIWADGVY